MKMHWIWLAGAVGAALSLAPGIAEAEDNPWEQPGSRAGQELTGPHGIVMVWVPGGKCMVGSEDGESDEKPIREVTLDGFWIGRTEVTVAQWRSVMESVPSGNDLGDDHPVVNVSWDQCQEFCNRAGLALPTEAQWEYAARGSQSRRYPWGDEFNGELLCYRGNKGKEGRTSPVGTFPDGASWCGPLDMLGNVWEWCADRYLADPSHVPGPGSGDKRVLRGGSWESFASYCRAANRSLQFANATREYASQLGLRVASGSQGLGEEFWSAVLSSSMPTTEAGTDSGEEVRAIGSRLELFVDDWIIESMEGTELRLHHPIPREVAWENDSDGRGDVYDGGNVTLFQDGDIYRMYYRGRAEVSPESVAKLSLVDTAYPEWSMLYAESPDGIHWHWPELNIFEVTDGKRNNVVWSGIGADCFAPFKDANPACPPEARYKAVARTFEGLEPGQGGELGFQSPDGIHWSLIQEQPIIVDEDHAFDSQNLAFWDSVHGVYREYHRKFRNGYRDIRTSTSNDFIHWSEPEWLDYGGAPGEHLYTNGIKPYFRAPHILVGLAKRMVGGREKIPDNPLAGGKALCDSVLMSSRDGVHFDRWLEAFIRPGLQTERWWHENNTPAWGIVVTKSDISGAPDELSFYSNEAYGSADACQRRFTLRMDGFVSVHAEYTGGEFTTKPLIFEGKELVLNYSTSAVGSVRVEIQDQEGNPIPGFTLADCPEMYGDAIEEGVRWKSGSDVSALAGQVVRLRFVVKDADLYSIRFRP